MTPRPLPACRHVSRGMTRGVTRAAPRALRTLLVAVLLAALALGAARPQAAHAGPIADVCSGMQDQAAAFDGRVGFVVLDLTDWTRCSYQASEVFTMASLYKLVVLAEAHEQAERGLFSFDEPIAVTQFVPATEDSAAGARTITMSAAEALRQMIQVSDNATADALRVRLVRESVAAAPARLGMAHTELGAEFTTTPNDIATYLTRLHAQRLVGPEADAAILELLLGQQINDRIPWFLPDGVAVAHKTGRLDRVAHDAGIVYAPAGPFVLALLTEGAVTQQQGYDVIRSLAAAAFEGFAEPRPQPVVALPPFSDLVATEGIAAVGPLAPASTAVSRVELAAEAAAAAAAAAPALTAEREVPPAVAQPGGGLRLPLPLPLPDFGTGGEPWWQSGPGLASTAAALALVPFALLGLRRRRRPLPVQPAVVYRGAERPAGQPRPVLLRAGDGTMRLGRRGKRSISSGETVRAFMPGGGSAGVDGETAAEATSPRLQRLAAYFGSQLELMEEMSEQVDSETAPLHQLLARQRGTIERVLSNLDERLGPIRDYAANEQSNLEALEERISGEGMDFIARSFSEYVTQQRQRIAETHQRIDDQREPFEQLVADQREAIELGLSRFDADIEALESNLTDQRRIVMRLLDAMRSQDFGDVRDFIDAREQVLAEAAERGVADPAEIAASMQALRRSLRPGATGNAHLDRVLESVSEADERLLNAGAGAGVHAVPPPPTPASAAPPAADDESREERTPA